MKSKGKSSWVIDGSWLIVLLFILIMGYSVYRIGYDSGKSKTENAIKEAFLKTIHSCRVYNQQNNQTILSLFTTSNEDCNKLGELFSTPIVQRVPVFYSSPLSLQPAPSFKNIQEQQVLDKTNLLLDKMIFGF